MVNFFTQSHTYDDNWATVTLAFFLRYPNPFAAHVLSCDVIDRSFTPNGTLQTTRLILKRGNLPKWFPAGVVARSESWIIEESEVDAAGRRMNCSTRNLEHTKALRVMEHVALRPLEDGRTLQTTKAQFLSRFGWGLTKRIENYASTKFRSNIDKSRQGIFLVLNLLRESRLQLQPLGDGPYGSTGTVFDTYVPRHHQESHERNPSTEGSDLNGSASTQNSTGWRRWKGRFGFRSS
ncbi:MSF1-domain-containing protein [Ceratobasidium sp. AG-I]|nr:MSF1-domain-containing protein [Ceratobasidium sp. AG-I]